MREDRREREREVICLEKMSRERESAYVGKG